MDSIRKILERPFPQELFKQRQGPGGKTFTYVEIQHYVDRLNLAFDGAWSFEITRREQVDEQLLVEGRLTAAGVVKTGLGGATVTRRRDDGNMISLADDYKKAEADALKRCCRLLGIGGHLYASDGDEEVEPAPPARSTPARTTTTATLARTTTAAPPPRTTTANPAPERNRLSAKQLSAIIAIAKSRGYDDKTFRAQIVERHGVQPEFLSRTQASAVISSMTGNGNGHDRHPGEDA